MGGRTRFLRLRSVFAGLLAAGLLAAGASSASAVPAAGRASRSEVQVTGSAVSAMMAPSTARGAQIDSAVASAAVAGVARSQRPLASSEGLSVPASTMAPLKAPSLGPLGVGWLLWVALVAVFLGLTSVVVVVLMAPTFVSNRQRRVDSIEGYVSAAAAQEDERSAVSAISASLVSMGDKFVDSRPSTPRTQLLLQRADLPVRAGEWAVLRAVAVLVCMAGGMFLLHGAPAVTFIGACLGVLVGAVLPSRLLKFAAARRSKKFERQLPDVLTLAASSLSTGFSLLQALDAVAVDADEPSAKEFSRALAETRIGADIQDSLDHLADRMDSKNMRWTAMAIDIQRQVGGNLAETLQNTAATIRDREALIRHIKGLSAEGRMSAYILIALPVGLFFYMLAVNKTYVQLLWTTVIGIGMSTAGLISLSIGIFWMNKMVKIEV